MGAISACYNYLKPIRVTQSFLRPLIFIGYNTGMRAGDNIGLIGSLINLETGFARRHEGNIKA